MSICPKNKSSKARRDKRRANWKMLVVHTTKKKSLLRINYKKRCKFKGCAINRMTQEYSCNPKVAQFKT